MTPATCPTCGSPLPADTPGAACPRCLLQAGFATGGTAAPSAGRVPSPEELAPKFPGLVIESVLGRGGMGVVYRARHKALDREVALKVLPATLAGDPAFAGRFQREARALAKLQHPNIVGVHDFGQTEDLFWLVMEFVDGTNIRQAMKAGAIHPKEALAIVPQICDALQYAHEHGVVHRDIKPENVLLDKSGRVKVADFGLAKMMEHGTAEHSLTGVGQVMGTPHYMAPEQWEHPKDVDHRADIYSLGVVFYEMLTGELPVGRFAAPSKKTDVDARIDEIVLRTLEREREARYQRVAEVKTDVGAVASSPAVAAPSAAAVAADEAEHRRRASKLFVAGCLAELPVLLVAVMADTAFVRIAALLLAVAVPVIVALSTRRRGGAAQRPHWGWWIVLGMAIFCGGPVALFLFLSLGNPVPRDARDVIRENNVVSQSVPHGPDLTVDDRRGIESKWRRLQEIGLGAGLEAVLRTYAHEDRGTLQSIPPGQRKSLGHQGLLGLPLLAPERLANPLSAFKITKMRPVGEEAKEAEVTATDDVVTITFPMRRTEGGSVWDFAKGGVQFRTVTVPARTAPTPEQTGDELRRVMEFWRDYRRSLYADEDFDERLARYAPVERARLKTMPAAEREKAAAELQLGLPLVPADKLPEGLGTSSLANMSSSPEQHATLGAVTHIRVEITAGGRTLRFWLVTGIVGDEKAVYFDAAPVEVK